MAKTYREKGLTFGDEVIYKNRRCVVLEAFSDGKIDRYHIYGPETGVYTAFDDEVRKIGHLAEADKLRKALSTPMEKTA